MSIQAQIRNIADHSFVEGNRSKGIALAIGLYLGIAAANSSNVGGDAADVFLQNHYTTTTEAIANLNETILFDVRDAQRITKAVFMMISAVKNNPVGLTLVAPECSLADSLFNLGSYLTEDDYTLFKSNTEPVIAIYNTLVAGEQQNEPV